MSAATVSAFIFDDGYTENGYIAAVPGIYPALRFEFRPMLIKEYLEYAKVSMKLEFFEDRREMAHALTKKLVRWDLKGRDGELVVFKPDNLLRLKLTLFDKLFKVVAGNVAPDNDPEQGDVSTDADDALVAEARKKGCTVAELRENRDAKN